MLVITSAFFCVGVHASSPKSPLQVRTPLTPSHVAIDTAAAVEATRDHRAGASRVSTIILPHDVSREKIVPEMFKIIEIIQNH